jgi:DUF4097 and DUF4098 domain-containing protein YvlB
MYEFDTPSPVALALKFAAGDAEIIAEDTTRATVDVSGADGSDASREAAHKTRVELRGDTLYVDAPESTGWGFRRGPRLRIVVRLPAGGDLLLKAASADVAARGRFADLKLTTGSGDLFVEHATGDAAIGSGSGDIRLNRIEGDLRVNASSGDISVGYAGGTIGAHCASGDLSIDEARGSINATTASGDVRIGTASAGTVYVKSASGDVSVGVAPGTGVWLDLSTLSGDTNSDLTMPEQSGGQPAATLTIQVRTASGDIDVHRSAVPTSA